MEIRSAFSQPSSFVLVKYDCKWNEHVEMNHELDRVETTIWKIRSRSVDRSNSTSLNLLEFLRISLSRRNLSGFPKDIVFKNFEIQITYTHYSIPSEFSNAHHTPKINK